MRLATMLRISPAIWFCPFLVWLAFVFVRGMPPAWTDPHALAITSAGTAALMIVVPVCAACAAWEGGRLRRAGWFTLPHVRLPLSVAGAALAPTLAVGIVMLIGAVGFTTVMTGVVVLPDVRVIMVALIVLFIHALLGFAIGLRVPAVVAVPTVFLLDFGWMVLPSTREPLWLRHLNGVWASCCMISDDLAPVAVLGALSVALGLALAAGILLRQHLVPFQAALAVLPVIVGVGVGVQFVNGLGPDPAIARDTSILICSTTQPRVCVWPEHRGRLEEVVEIATAASAAWQQAGVIVPTEFSEAPLGIPGARDFGFSLESDRYSILNSLAYRTLPPWPECALRGSSSYQGASAESYLLAWLDATAGMPAMELAARFRPAELETVEWVRTLPLEQQQIWLERNLLALEQCNVPPQLEPPL